MTPKEAVEIAKRYVAELFATDGAMNIGLEELRYDENADRWSVTIGFSRVWEGPQGVSRWMEKSGEPWPRTFKLVEIDGSDGRVIEVTHRSLAA
jgi:hypothetical protein